MANPSYRPAVTGFKAQDTAPGISAFNKQLQSAMSSIQDLAQESEDRAKATNTQNMIAQMQQQADAGGLGGMSENPMDINAINMHFGGAIDMEAVAGANTANKERLNLEATNVARSAANKVFSEGMDETAAGELFKQSLLDQNVSATDADSQYGLFRQDNAYRAADRKNIKAKAMDDLRGSFYSSLQGKTGVNTDAAITLAVADIEDPAERFKAVTMLRGDADTLSQMSEDDKIGYEDFKTRVGREQEAYGAESALMIESAESQYKQSNPISPKVSADRREFEKSPGGILEGMRAKMVEPKSAGAFNAMVNIFTGKWNQSTGDKAFKEFAQSFGQLSDSGDLTEEEAATIAYQAMQSTYGEQVSGTGALGFNKRAFKEKAATLVQEFIAHKGMLSQINDLKADRLAGSTALQKKNDDATQRFRKALRAENLTGQAFDRSAFDPQGILAQASAAAGDPQAPAEVTQPEAPASPFDQYFDEDPGEPEPTPEPAAPADPMAGLSIDARLEAEAKVAGKVESEANVQAFKDATLGVFQRNKVDLSGRFTRMAAGDTLMADYNMDPVAGDAKIKTMVEDAGSRTKAMALRKLIKNFDARSQLLREINKFYPKDK